MDKRRNRLYIGIILCAALALAVYMPLGNDGEREKKMAFLMMEKLSNGINIGNNLDVYDVTWLPEDVSPEEYEMAWGNAPVSKELIAAVKNAGFASVRIPVTWSEHCDDEWMIDDVWMARVRTVVDWVLDEGLYVILDSHHETFLTPKKEQEEVATEQFRTLWGQIAAVFASYDERLLFEGMNEARLVGTADEWTSGTEEAREVINDWNEVFIETVRNAGGENENRYLLIPGYATRYEHEALAAIRLPEKDYRIMVSVHAYLPYLFTEADMGNEVWEEQDSAYTGEISALAEDLRSLFLDNDIPVVVTEFGCEAKQDNGERLKWAKYITDSWKSLGVPYFWWDDGKEYAIFDRESATVAEEDLVKVLVGE